MNQIPQFPNPQLNPNQPIPPPGAVPPEQALINLHENTIFFPGIMQDCIYLVKQMCTQFEISEELKEDIAKIESSQVIGFSFPPDTDLDEIIRNLSGLKILNPNDRKDQYLEFNVCRFKDLKQVIDQLQNKATKLIISAPRLLQKSNAPPVSEGSKMEQSQSFNIDFLLSEVKEFLKFRKIENYQNPYDDSNKTAMVIDFTNQRIDEATRALVDLSCMYFYGTYLKVQLVSPEQKSEQGDCSRKLFEKLGNDGIRRDVRKEFGEYITNEQNYNISQVMALTPKDNDQSKYNRLFGLLLVLFQFPALKDPHFMVFVESFADRNNGCIIGTIHINARREPRKELEQLKSIVRNAFSSISIMKLTGFCVLENEDTNNGTALYRFSTSWCNKTSHAQ